MASRWRLSVAALVAAVAASGCAGLPSGGPVHPVGPVTVEGPLAASGIRVLAVPPTAGATPPTLVRQFLVASADPADNFAVARTFLAGPARRAWNPAANVTIYPGQPGTLAPVWQGDEVTVVVPSPAATIRGGDYSLAAGPPSPQTLSFQLTRVHGQWRFSAVPPGIFTPASLLPFVFKPINVYFLDPAGHRLVPDRVFLMTSRSALPAAVVRAVLAGPSPWLRGAVTSAVPSGTRLVGVPQVRDGVLSVDLSVPGPPLAPDIRSQLAAQLLWTAGQLPEVSGVTIQVNGAPILPGLIGPLTATGSALGFDPNGLLASAPGYFVVPAGARTVLRSTAGASWPFVAGNQGLRHPAISLDRTEVAGLTCANGRCGGLYVGELATLRTVPLHLVLSVRSATDTLTPPSFDSSDNAVWTVEPTGPTSSTVWSIAPNDKRTAVAAPGLAGQRVLALRLARDGTRVAVVTIDPSGATHVLVGTVLHRAGGIRIAGLKDVVSGLTGAVDVSWEDASHLVVLARATEVPGSVASPYRVLVDGSGQPQPVLGTAPGGQPVSLAAAPGHPLLVATSTTGAAHGAPSTVAQLQGQTWSVLRSGVDPAYPG